MNFNRKLFNTTDTELNAIAALANIGFKSNPFTSSLFASIVLNESVSFLSVTIETVFILASQTMPFELVTSGVQLAMKHKVPTANSAVFIFLKFCFVLN